MERIRFKTKIINIVSVLVIVCFLAIKLILHLPILNDLKYMIYIPVMISYGFIMVIMHIAIAVWLFVLAKVQKQIPVLWCLLGLVFGLIAVFTYYWRLIYLKVYQNEN